MLSPSRTFPSLEAPKKECSAHNVRPVSSTLKLLLITDFRFTYSDRAWASLSCPHWTAGGRAAYLNFNGFSLSLQNQVLNNEHNAHKQTHRILYYLKIWVYNIYFSRCKRNKFIIMYIYASVAVDSLHIMLKFQN